jgi:CRP/FNR family transcriptional regulator, cyclic AMP receptor protein
VQWALLAGLSETQVGDVLALARRRAFRRAEVVFHEGDPADSLHLVVSGHVSVRVTTALGDVATVRIIGPGEFFGELALISPGPRNATITALEGCESLMVHRDQVEQLRQSEPAVERALLQAVVQEVRRLTEQLVEVMYVPAAARLVRRLVELTQTYPPGPDGRIRIPLTQADLAGLCGTARPTMNQFLNRLAERGLIEVGRGHVTIRDLDGLRRRAER